MIRDRSLRIALILGVGLLIAGAMRSDIARGQAGYWWNSPSDTLHAFNLKHAVYQELSAKAQEEGFVRVIIRLSESFQPEGGFLRRQSILSQRIRIQEAQDGLFERLQAFNFVEIRRLETLPIVVLQVDASALQDLAVNPQVLSIEEDQPEPLTLTESVPLIGGDVVWSQGYTGTGQTVVILDTGVDPDHEFLLDKLVAEACFSTTLPESGSSTVCPNGLTSQIGDGAGVHCSLLITGCSHGTHVAGIAAGDGGTFSGVAPDASIIAIQVFSRFDDESLCGGAENTPCVLSWPSDQIAALDHVAVLSNDHTIAAVNMSLGSGQYSTFCDSDSRKLAIDNLRSLGIATVISSGNEGATDGIGKPACISSAISVGSSTKADVLSGFSNVVDFISLLAPGSSINSSVPGGSYASWNGTSMAAPHVTGAWALLKSKDNDATVTEILTALRGTGLLIDDERSGGEVLDMPRIQVDAALQQIAPEPTVTPTSTATAQPDPVGSTSWYLAEGYTGPGFETFILIQNPNDSEASVTVSYLLEGGGQVDRQHTVAGNSRYTIAAQDTGEVGVDQAFSTTIVSDLPIIVERAMYFPTGGHNTLGITAPSTTWHLAEGYTGDGFNTFILIQNPNGTQADVTVRYLLQDGSPIDRQHTIPPNSRYTIAAQEPTEVGLDQAFSTTVMSDQPVIVERAMYFSSGGHNTIGITLAELNWYLAEGYTGAGMGTYVLVQNPNPVEANIQITYYLQGDVPILRQHIIPAESRYTIVTQDPGEVGVDQAFSTWVNSDVPVIVERAMYFGTGGHNTIGMSTSSTSWNLAEGYTGAGFQTYLLIQNPNPSDAQVNVSYLLEQGAPLDRQHVVPANSRYTIVTQDSGEVGLDQAFSTSIQSDLPIIVERAMYFGSGGHNTIGFAIH